MSKLSRLVHNFFSEKKQMTLDEVQNHIRENRDFPSHIVLIGDSHGTTPMRLSRMNFGPDTTVEYNGPEFYATGITAKQIIHTSPARASRSRHRVLRSDVQKDIVNNVEHVVFAEMEKPAEIYLNNVHTLKLRRNILRPRVNIGNRFSLEKLTHDDPVVSNRLSHICPNLSTVAV